MLKEKNDFYKLRNGLDCLIQKIENKLIENKN